MEKPKHARRSEALHFCDRHQEAPTRSAQSALLASDPRENRCRGGSTHQACSGSGRAPRKPDRRRRRVDATALAGVGAIIGAISGMGTSGDMENAKAVAKWGAEKGGASGHRPRRDLTAGGNKLKKLAMARRRRAHYWLVRALTFIQVMVKEMMADRQKSLKDCVTGGYAASLKPHHGMIVKGVFAAAVKMAPSVTSLSRSSTTRRTRRGRRSVR